MTGQTHTLADEVPVWSLDLLYPDPESPPLRADLTCAGALADAFAAEFEGRLADALADVLANAIARYEAIQELLGRASNYAFLQHSTATLDPGVQRFYQAVNEQVSDITARLLFVPLEIGAASRARFDDWIRSEALFRWRPWLERLREQAAHRLDGAVEKAFHDKHASARDAWIRLYNETMTRLVVDADGEARTLAEATSWLGDADRARRRAAASGISTALEEVEELMVRALNAVLKDRQVEERWRGYRNPWSEQNLSDQVEDGVMEALTKTVADAAPRLSHRYYQWKAGELGLTRLDYSDRTAPLPGANAEKLRFAEARALVLAAYSSFDPALGELARRFFDEQHIDARPRAGKQGGAFASPSKADGLPFVFTNFAGRTRDAAILAHEIGHGIHMMLSAPCGHLQMMAPGTFAETASVFGEMLTFQSLLERTTDPDHRKALIAGKVEDMLHTSVRQIASYRFERRLHLERREGELSPARVRAIWLEEQRASLGPAVDVPDAVGSWWMLVPHFFQLPFYVAVYAFADCVVNSLYAVYDQADSNAERADFRAAFGALLRSGHMRRHRELLAPFGLDAADPDFWSGGLAVIEKLIDALDERGAANGSYVADDHYGVRKG